MLTTSVNTYRFTFSKDSTLVTCSAYLCVLLIYMFYVCIGCFVETEVHYSFAALQPHQPVLLRFWWVSKPSTDTVIYNTQWPGNIKGIPLLCDRFEAWTSMQTA